MGITATPLPITPIAKPIQAQASQGDTDLGDAQKAFGVRKKLQRRARRYVSLGRQLVQAGSANGYQRHLRGGEEPVQNDDREQ